MGRYRQHCLRHARQRLCERHGAQVSLEQLEGYCAQMKAELEANEAFHLQGRIYALRMGARAYRVVWDEGFQVIVTVLR